jgi:N-methylhydantoinase B
VAQGKVSREAAERDYGVVLAGVDALGAVPDEAATAELRARLAAERDEPPMFDRGPGYPQLSGGATEAEVDR